MTDEPIVPFDHPKAIQGKVLKLKIESTAASKSKPSTKSQRITSKESKSLQLSGQKIKETYNPWTLQDDPAESTQHPKDQATDNQV